MRAPSTALLLSLFGLSACSYDGQDPIAPPLYSHGAAHVVSGSVFGPGAISICEFLPPNALVRVRAVNLAGSPLIAATRSVFCPFNTFDLTLNPGTYRLQTLLIDAPLAPLPFRSLDLQDVVLDGGDVTRDVHVVEGFPLGGSATLDGAPLANLDLTLVYDFSRGLGAAFGGSGPDGTWRDITPVFRSPLLVQGGHRYAVQAQCVGLGTRTINAPPAGGFLFPDEVSAINCTLETSPAVQYTHERTRLVVTSMPADIGGSEPALSAQYGSGWGVQFPVTPPARPAHVPLNASQLFRGGLLIGLAPDIILSGNDLGAYGLECGAACRDLGAGATVKLVSQGGMGKIIRWTYSDAASPEAVGLGVVQHSFDGKPPADYVLLQYTITNRGRSTRTFFAGFFGDWDVGGTFAENIGFTELSGRLMYMTNARGGIHAGSVILGAPVAGTFFFENAPGGFSLVDQVRAMSGELRRSSVGPSDARAIHAVGPMTLKRDKSAVVWIAIVAGESRGQLLANARAAAAHVDEMLTQATFAGSVSTTSLEFGETLVVRPAPTLPWDGDEIVSFAGAPAQWVLESGSGAIAVVVPRLPLGPSELLVHNQGPDQVTEALTVTVASTFTPIGLSELTTAPDISAGPFPRSFFIELSNDAPNHFLTVAPPADLPVTVTLEWRTPADLDILWMNSDGSAFVGNVDGATLRNPERTSVTVPAGETYRLRFNKFDATAASTLARVTITSP